MDNFFVLLFYNFVSKLWNPEVFNKLFWRIDQQKMTTECQRENKSPWHALARSKMS